MRTLPTTIYAWSTEITDNTDMGAWLSRRDDASDTEFVRADTVDASIAEAVRAERNNCAYTLEKMVQDILREQGSYDGTTGVTELPEHAEQDIETLESAIAAIRERTNT